MSLGKRQLSGSKLKFDADYYKNALEQQEKKRPGSGQPLSTITSPLPPRKPVYSGKLRSIIPPSENVNQQHRIIKSSNGQQKQQLTPSVTQSQLQGVVSPPKANKPPLQFDKKLIMPKQNTSSQISIKSSIVPNQIQTGEKKVIQKSIEKPGTLTSPGQNDKQFTWKNQIELIVTQSDFENKRRQISHEKLKQIPKQQVQQLPFDQKRPTQPIIQQTQSHIIISQSKQPLQIQQIQKKQPYNPKQINITQSQSQSQLQGSQPKCFTDFTMTSGRNDLQQLFSSMQLQLKEASQYAEQHPNLNMSEIQEQPDDVNSSFAQSTLYYSLLMSLNHNVKNECCITKMSLYFTFFRINFQYQISINSLDIQQFTKNQPNNYNFNIININHNWIFMTDSSSYQYSINEGQYEAKIGEKLKNNQYQIIKWLGDGTFSKVWLAKDLLSSVHYALKIQSSLYSDAAMEEIEILKILNQNENSPQWINIQKNFIGNQPSTHCVKMIDSFVHVADETLHYCVVMEILGPTLLDLIRFYEKKHSSISIQLGKEITKQILIGLIYSHDACQIIHTDIKPENIMIELNEQQLKQLINENESEEQKKKVKLNNINVGDTFVWNENVIVNVNTDLKFKLVDFGNACQTNQQFEEIQTKEYKSPESIIQAKYQTNTDIWSLACVIFEILTNNYLFQPEGDTEEEEMDDLLAMMIELIGLPSQSFLSKGQRSSLYFESDGNLKRIKELQKVNLSSTLIKEYNFDKNEAQKLEDFILFALKWDPLERPSSQIMFFHPWLRQ